MAASYDWCESDWRPASHRQTWTVPKFTSGSMYGNGTDSESRNTHNKLLQPNLCHKHLASASDVISYKISSAQNWTLGSKILFCRVSLYKQLPLQQIYLCKATFSALKKQLLQ